MLHDLQEIDGFRLEYLETADHIAAHVPARFYRMRNADGDEVGTINLRLESSLHVVLYSGHIGYGVHPAFRGNRYAARAVRMLSPVARQYGIDPLWITTDPENTASRRICELAGAEYVETVNVVHHNGIFPVGHPRKCRYRLSTDGGESIPVAIPSEEP
jgi:predicted acetyltransferase